MATVAMYVLLGEVCHGVWQAVFQCVTVTLMDPGILSVSPILSPLLNVLRIAVKMKTFKPLVVTMVTELCNLYSQIPFKLSSENMSVVSMSGNKVCYPSSWSGVYILCVCCLTESVTMAILIRDIVTSIICTAKSSHGYHQHSVQVLPCQWPKLCH